jgi:hypothetical protein
MCELCPTNSDPSPINRRRKIWETNAARHCSIIGTCLTLSDIRGLARKLGYASNKDDSTDFNLHGHFVREAGSKSLVAKLLNKLLDRKHAATIKKFQKLQSTDELVSAWDDAYQIGDIPGPYWAVLSHPRLTEPLALRIYGEVHMLSHLAGASNRADRSTLKRLETEIAPLEDRLKKEGQRHAQLLDEKERTIAELRREVASLKGQVSKAPKVKTPAPANDDNGLIKRNVTELQQRLSTITSENEDLRAANVQLSSTVPELEAEVRALELAMEQDGANTCADDCPFDLDGCNILYVGGRAPQVCRFRDMVARWNGELSHHDGGLERSLDELARAIGKADAVVFPTDCVSHNAALKVKRLCQQTMKPYIPLRTSGTASLLAGLRDSLQELSPAGETH